MEFGPMSPEEIERTVQFLLTRQAQFASDLATLSGQVNRLADGMVDLTGVVGQGMSLLGQLAEGQSRVVDALERVAEAHAQLAEAQAQLTAAHAQLAAAQARTDERLRETDARLNIVIDMFERHLRESHGPRPA